MSKFNMDEALNNVDYSFPNYIPSEQSLEFFNLLRLVQGKDFEFRTPMLHYFWVDVLFGNVKVENFPYSKKIRDTITMNVKRVALCCSRGLAKSSVVTAFMPVYLAIKGVLPKYGRIYFVLLLGASAQGSGRVMAKAIQSLCQDSKFCLEFFEDMRFTETEAEFTRRGKEQLDDRTFLVRTMGYSGGVRGTRSNVGLHRPDIIMFDDAILNTAAAYSKTQMDTLEEIIFSDAENALVGGGKGRIWHVFTPFHNSDPNSKILASGAYTQLVFPICEGINEKSKVKNIKSAWIDMHPPQAILGQYNAAKASNKLQSFMQERMLRVTSEEERMIPEHMLSWYEDRRLVIDNLEKFSLVITTDFTASTNKNSDYSAIALWAIGGNDDKYLLDLYLKKCTIVEQYDALFTMISKWSRYSSSNSIEVGVEINGQQQLNIVNLDRMMIEKNVWFRYARQKGKSPGQRGIRSTGSKVDRLRNVVPEFEMGKIRFPKELKDTPEMVEAMNEIRLASHDALGCVSADTKVYTDKGLISIRDVAVGDRVLSQYYGSVREFKVTAAIISGIADTYTVYTSTGVMHLTAGHKVLTDEGFKEVRELDVADKLVTGSRQWNKLKRTDINGQEKVQGTINQLVGLVEKENGYIDTRMKGKRELFQKAWIYITRTITRKTIGWITWKSYHDPIIRNTMLKQEMDTITKEHKSSKISCVSWLGWLKEGCIKVKERLEKRIKGKREESASTAEKSLHSKKQTKTEQSTVHQCAERGLGIKRLTQIISRYLWKSVWYVAISSNRKLEIRRLVQKSVENSLKETELTLKLKREGAKNAEESSRYPQAVFENSVQKSVKEKIEKKEKSSIDVLCVEKPIQQKLKEKGVSSVQEGVELVTVDKIEHRKTELVYDISVECSNNFTVETGVVIHNSVHDDFLDVVSQLGLIEYIRPNGEALPEQDYKKEDSSLWGLDWDENEDGSDNCEIF